MSIYTVDWSSLLSSTSILPPDIFIRIIPGNGQEEVVLKAHSLVLSLLSPVFRVYLSEGGSWYNAGTEVVIKDASSKPFQIMLNFFYKKNFNISQEFTDIEDLFEIIKVADQFQVENLVNLCKNELMNIPMRFNSLINIVNIAKCYRNLAPFITISDEIIDHAVEFLTTKLKTTAAVVLFLAQSDTDKPELEDAIKLELLKMMSSQKCKKCGELLLNKCKCKYIVSHENMVSGARIEVIEISRFRYDSSRELKIGHQGKIIDFNDEGYTIQWDVEGILTYQLDRDLHVPMKFIRN